MHHARFRTHRWEKLAEGQACGERPAIKRRTLFVAHTLHMPDAWLGSSSFSERETVKHPAIKRETLFGKK